MSLVDKTTDLIHLLNFNGILTEALTIAAINKIKEREDPHWAEKVEEELTMAISNLKMMRQIARKIKRDE